MNYARGCPPTIEEGGAEKSGLVIGEKRGPWSFKKKKKDDRWVPTATYGRNIRKGGGKQSRANHGVSDSNRP